MSKYHDPYEDRERPADAELRWFFGPGAEQVEPPSDVYQRATAFSTGSNAERKAWGEVSPFEKITPGFSQPSTVDPDPHPHVLVRYGRISRAILRLPSPIQATLQLAFGSRGRAATEGWLYPGRQWRAVAELTEAAYLLSRQWVKTQKQYIAPPANVLRGLESTAESKIDGGIRAAFIKKHKIRSTGFAAVPTAFADRYAQHRSAKGKPGGNTTLLAWLAFADAPITEPGPVEFRYLSWLDEVTGPRHQPHRKQDLEAMSLIWQQSNDLIKKTLSDFDSTMSSLWQHERQIRRASVQVALGRREPFPEDYQPGGRRHVSDP